jgi:cellulose biosynthesis protein BcsQ
MLIYSPPIGKELEATQEGLKNFGLAVIKDKISSLQDYQRAFGNGEGVTEYDAESKASIEMNTLFDWILKRTKREVFNYAKA